MSTSVLLFLVGISGANLSRFLPKKESRDSTTCLISLFCFNFYIELTLNGWLQRYQELKDRQRASVAEAFEEIKKREHK